MEKNWSINEKPTAVNVVWGGENVSFEKTDENFMVKYEANADNFKKERNK